MPFKKISSRPAAGIVVRWKNITAAAAMGIGVGGTPQQGVTTSVSGITITVRHGQPIQQRKNTINDFNGNFSFSGEFLLEMDGSSGPATLLFSPPIKQVAMQACTAQSGAFKFTLTETSTGFPATASGKSPLASTTSNADDSAVTLGLAGTAGDLISEIRIDKPDDDFFAINSLTIVP